MVGGKKCKTIFSKFENFSYWLRLNEFAFDVGIETKNWDVSILAAGDIIPVYKEVPKPKKSYKILTYFLFSIMAQTIQPLAFF